MGQESTSLNFHPEALGAVQKRVLQQLGPLMSQGQFYLGGGTALAIRYGLVYFDDADRERMPRMLWDTDWRVVKKTLREWVRTIAG